MERIMVILSEEPDYARELAAYLSSREDFIYKPIVFTDPEAFLRYEKDNHVDLLLCDDEEFLSGNKLNAKQLCLLSEYSKVSEFDGNRKAIFKYQSSEAIMKEIMSCYGISLRPGAKSRQPDETDSKIVAGGTRLICVCSPIGGSRCSTYALGLAEFFAKKGEALFLSLDPFFKVEGITEREEAGSLTELMYCLETGREGRELLSEYVRRRGGADCLPGFSNWLDPQDINEEQALKLMKCIRSEELYRYIVIDMGRPFGAFLEFIALCGDIYVPRHKGKHDDDVIAEWKRQLTCTGYGDIAGRLKERTIPNDKGLEGGVSADRLLDGSLGGYIRETEDFGHIG